MILLPRLLVLTDRRRSEEQGRPLVETVAAAVEGGARAVLLREKDLPDPAREELGRELLDLVAREGGVLIVASDRELAARLAVAGVHLAASEDWRPVEELELVVGRSCHDLDELRRARQTGADYATLSPLYPSPSKPGYGPTLGPERLAMLLRQVRNAPPVFALGGMTAERVQPCLEAGAYGVAVMGAVMGAQHPAQSVAAFMDRLPEPTPFAGG
ncbi:MAG: thiamine phosphate synthase [Actinomycetota bacterium]|nr:thiamine phosphate synthase [Actinomycetota bacterium]